MRFIQTFLIQLFILASAVQHGLAQETGTDMVALSGGKCSVLEPDNNDTQEIANVAFIIGNGSYHPRIGWLENPSNDASAFAAIALRLGFHVYAITEGTSEQISSCLNQLHQKHTTIGKSIFYYSGHGLQQNNKNYILPIDLTSDIEIKDNAIAVDPIISGLRKKSNLSLVFFDACRSNPVNGESGLALTENVVGLNNNENGIPSAQFIYMFATQPGNIAEEGTGKFSPFTEGLIQHFGTEGKSLSENLVAVTSYVGAKTKWKQIPFVRSSLSDLVFLNKTFSLDDLKTKSDAYVTRSQEALKVGQLKKSLQYAVAAIPLNASDEKVEQSFPNVISNLRNKSFLTTAIVDAGEAPFRIAEFSPDNDRLLTGNELGEYKNFSVKLWNLKDGTVIWEEKFARNVTFLNNANTVEFSPDGERFFVKTKPWKAEIRNSFDGSLIVEIPLKVANRNSYASGDDEPDVISVSFSPSGEKIILDFRQAAYGETHTRRMFQVNDATEIALLHAGNISPINKENGTVSHQVFSFINENELCFMAIVDRNKGSFSEPINTLAYWGTYNPISGESKIWQTEPDYFQLGALYNSITCSDDGKAMWFSAVKKSKTSDQWLPKSGMVQANGITLTVDGNRDYGTSSTPVFSKDKNLLLVEGETGEITGYEIESGDIFIQFKRTDFAYLKQIYRKDGTIAWQGGHSPNIDHVLSRLLSNEELITIANGRLGQEELKFIEENRLQLQ